MELTDKVVVVTGGANGIGRALCRRFVAKAHAASSWSTATRDGVQTVAAELGDGALGLTADVAVEADIINVVEHTEEHFGPIDSVLLERRHRRAAAGSRRRTSSGSPSGRST